jgi:hypothetical protein
MPQGPVDGIDVDTCWILNAMPSTGPCGIEMFYVDTSGILNAMSSTELCDIETFYVDTSGILNAMPSTELCVQYPRCIHIKCFNATLSS